MASAARAHVPTGPRARHCVNQWSTVPMHPGAGWTQPCNAMRAMGPVNSRVLMIGGSVDRWIGGSVDRAVFSRWTGGTGVWRAHAVAGPAAHAAEDAAK